MKRLLKIFTTLCISFCFISPGYAKAEAPAPQQDTFWMDNFIPMGVANFQREDYVTGTLVAAADITALFFLAQGLSVAYSMSTEGDNGYGGLALIGALGSGFLSYAGGRAIGAGGYAIQNQLQNNAVSSPKHPTDHNGKSKFTPVPTILSLDF